MNETKDINHNSNKFFYNLERQKKTNITLPSASSNKNAGSRINAETSTRVNAHSVYCKLSLVDRAFNRG